MRRKAGGRERTDFTEAYYTPPLRHIAPLPEAHSACFAFRAHMIRIPVIFFEGTVVHPTYFFVATYQGVWPVVSSS